MKMKGQMNSDRNRKVKEIKYDVSIRKKRKRNGNINKRVKKTNRKEGNVSGKRE